jgi:CheY-like chemotaxis protein
VKREPARLVVVDDQPAVRESMAELLRTAGYHVSVAESGAAALALLEHETVDLLLTDFAMPEMSGWDLARAVRAREITNTRGGPLCVGLYSAAVSAFNREQLARARIDFTVTKLSDPESVLDAVERALAWAEVR